MDRGTAESRGRTNPLSPPSFRWLFPPLLLILGGALFLPGTVLLLHYWKGFPIAQMTKDPLATLGAPIYTGYLSNLGILLWTGTAAVCLFGSSLLPRWKKVQAQRRFLLFSGLFTLLLAVDDLFMLHEVGFPSYAGIPERAVLGGYAVLAVLFPVWFRRVILRTDYPLLALALLLLGLSAAIDILLPAERFLLLEDSLKMAGILSWLVYFVRATASVLRQGTRLTGETGQPCP